MGHYRLGVRADAESLRQIPLFRNCEAVPLQVLAFAADRKQFDRGDFLLKEGEKAKAAYFILNGNVRLERDGQVIGAAQPGALLGEVSMLASSTSSLTAIAEDDVSTVRIDSALFQRVAKEYPEFGQAVLETLSARLGHSMGEFDQVRQMLARARGFSSL